MKYLLTLFSLITIINVLNTVEGFSQGCSDAGVCTIHSLRDNTSPEMDSTYYNSVTAGISYGLGEESVTVLTPYLEYHRQFGDNFSLSGKMTFAATNGDLGDAAGPGDIFISGTYRLSKESDITPSVIAGLKIPLSSGNETNDDGTSLPMVYQPGLGTYDIYLGVNFTYEAVALGLAFQQPLSGANENSYLPVSDQSPFPPTNEYERKGDLIVRFSYNTYMLDDDLKILFSVLPIYHIANDTYTDINGGEQEIEESQGLTLNGNILFRYSLDDVNTITLSLGSPFITREVIPDGLKRSLVAGLEYGLRF